MEIQVGRYLTMHDVILQTQSGFRPDFNNNWSTGLSDVDEAIILVVLNYSKAFGILNY